jgi:hypothetical protein
MENKVFRLYSTFSFCSYFNKELEAAKESNEKLTEENERLQELLAASRLSPYQR